MENSISSDLIRGHIDTIILYSLVDCDKFAQQISDSVLEKSQNQYEINQATLYSSLKRLENLNYVKSYWNDVFGGRRKFFRLTDDGKKFIDDNLSSWTFSRSIIDKLLNTAPNANIVTPNMIETTPTGVLNNSISDNIQEDNAQNDNEFNEYVVESDNNNENIKNIDKISETIEKKSTNYDNVSSDDIKNDFEVSENKNKIDTNQEVSDEKPVESPHVSAEEIAFHEKENNFRNILQGLIAVTKLVEEEDLETSTENALKIEERKDLSKELSTVVESKNKQFDRNKNSIDFSTLEINAEKESYKIRFSNSKSVNKKGKILINKVSLFSSFMTSILLLIEFFSFICFVENYIALTSTYWIIGSSCIVLPIIICAIKYVFNKDKRIKNIKNTEIITCIIVFFDFLLLLFVFEWLLGINFSNTFDFVCYYILPCAIIFDSIMYVLFKLLLSKFSFFKTNKNI